MTMKRCNLEYLFMKIISCTFHMHITMQRSICLQQEQSHTFLIAFGYIKAFVFEWSVLYFDESDFDRPCRSSLIKF